MGQAARVENEGGGRGGDGCGGGGGVVVVACQLLGARWRWEIR